MKPLLKSPHLLTAIAAGSFFGLGLLVGNMGSPERKGIPTALNHKKDSQNKTSPVPPKEPTNSVTQLVPDAAPALANQVPAASSLPPTDASGTRTENSTSVADSTSGTLEQTRSKKPASSDNRIASNSRNPSGLNPQPQPIFAGSSSPRPVTSAVQTSTPKSLPAANSESPSSKGNSLQFAGQKVTIEAAGNVGGNKGLALDVAITPAETETSSGKQATSPKGAVNLEYGGLTYEEFRFRQQWGWAAFDAARRAANSVANGN